ncbi:MAG: sigma-70 family RNA polymerase sigma factor [Candidatus Pseudobacter hemicellulosilyticus]|uniref:Sigma-70 family RNA polymerase sigma factor n=1 Tax=Candidatus Pseudobacter hemicellulosilyticus TaxID=3121375 RepID=A0AAJ5WN42_9BACT|nr:MAG: sigma-70 family RNA polymerase sigma factor [Pseudobacter sp.]
MSVTTPYHDAELLALLEAGDAAAFRSVYQEHYRQLLYFGFQLVQDLPQAEDLVTEAFVSLWKSRGQLKSRAHLKSYLFLAVKHGAIDWLRAQQTQSALHQQLLQSGASEENRVEALLAESEFMRLLTEELEQLPVQCARVVRHILFDGMTTAEVAAAMNISTKNVLNQKLLAIKKLRQGLLKKGLLEIFFLFSKFFC